MDVQRKDYPDLKRSPKRNIPQQLQTHNVPTDNVENTKSTNYDPLISPVYGCPRKRKDATERPEEYESNNTLINTSSRTDK